MKIITVVGNRPQFVKAAAIIRSLETLCLPGLTHLLVHTGQHYDTNMSDVFFKEMDIPSPDYHLGIFGTSHGAMTGKMLEKIEALLIKETPQCVIVLGDTNSTLSGALAAVKLHIPVAHVEAGLRSYNRRMPEEINRILTDHCSHYLFSPTNVAAENLIKEGIASSKIHLVGDVMYDAFLHYKRRALENSNILSRLSLVPKEYSLATLHRAENTDDPIRLQNIARGILSIAREMPVVLPLHPRTKNALEKVDLLDVMKKELLIIDPVGYFDMLQLENHARIILTDSGGIQKEAFFSQVPCLTLRDETEWTELVTAGFNRLVPADEKQILQHFHNALESPPLQPSDLYGRGISSQMIISTLCGAA